MQIKVALVPELAGDVSKSVCVVIDMLRATTVIPTLFEQGCPRVYVTDSHDKARTFARANGYVLCGETEGYRVADFDFGNSPVEFSRLSFASKPVVLSTTNGTKATAIVSHAQHVFLGATINRMAVSKTVWEIALASNLDITLVCSGTRDQFTLEDAVVAGGYVEAIAGLAGAWESPILSDSAIACRRLWQSEPNLLRGLMEGCHAQTLANRGFGEDIGYCCSIDRFAHVPTLVAENQADSLKCPVILVI